MSVERDGTYLASLLDADPEGALVLDRREYAAIIARRYAEYMMRNPRSDEGGEPLAYVGDLDRVREALGVRKDMPSATWGSRNRCLARQDDPVIRRLVAAGYMRHRPGSHSMKGEACFEATLSGARAIALTPAQERRAFKS